MWFWENSSIWEQQAVAYPENADFQDFSFGYRVGVQYICSLYWALSVMTNLKGLPAHESRQCLWYDPLVREPLGERCYTIVVFLIGSVCYSFIYGNIAQFVQNLYSSGLRYRKRMEELKEFVRFHNLPPSLQE